MVVACLPTRKRLLARLTSVSTGGVLVVEEIACAGEIAIVADSLLRLSSASTLFSVTV